MSKYRCPVCGAPHKELTTKCRLCGHDISPDTPVTGPSTAPASRAGRKTGLGSILLITLAVVVLVAVGALVLGLVDSNEQIDEVRREIPGLSDESDDGWTELGEPLETKLVVDLPGEREKSTTELPGVDGEATTWTAVVGRAPDPVECQNCRRDTVISVSHGTSARPEDTSELEFLEATMTTYLEQRGATETSRDDTEFAGEVALTAEYQGRELDGEFAYGKVLMVEKEGVLYVVDVESIYESVDQFDRVLDALVLIPGGAEAESPDGTA